MSAIESVLRNLESMDGPGKDIEAARLELAALRAEIHTRGVTIDHLVAQADSYRAAIKAADAMRAYFDETTLTMNRIRDKEAPGLMWALTEEYVDGAAPLLAAYDAARAEHERSAEK